MKAGVCKNWIWVSYEGSIIPTKIAIHPMKLHVCANYKRETHDPCTVTDDNISENNLQRASLVLQLQF